MSFRYVRMTKGFPLHWHGFSAAFETGIDNTYLRSLSRFGAFSFWKNLHERIQRLLPWLLLHRASCLEVCLLTVVCLHPNFKDVAQEPDLHRILSAMISGTYDKLTTNLW